MPDTYYAAETARGSQDGETAADACAFGGLYLLGGVGDNYYLCRNEDGSAWELDSAGDDLHITAFNDGSSTNPKIISGCNHLGVIDGVRTKFKFSADPNEMFYLESGTEYVRFENIEVDMDGESIDVIECDGTTGNYCIANNIHAYNGNRCVSFRGSNCRIHNCYAKDMAEYGYVLTGGGNGMISNCIAIKCGTGSSEAGYYLTDGASVVNSLASECLGHSVRVVGDYCSVIGNTLDQSGDRAGSNPRAAIKSSGNALTVINNIISNSNDYGLQDNGGNELNLSDYNLFFNNATANYRYQNAGIHDITGNPLFTDPANYDYSIGINSPAWRAGTNNDTIGYTRRPPGASVGGWNSIDGGGYLYTS